jgi:hypothetical protein
LICIRARLQSVPLRADKLWASTPAYIEAEELFQ